MVESLNVAERIANLDLSVAIDEKELKRKDEAGQMYKAFQNILDNLKVFMEEMDNAIITNYETYERILGNWTIC